MKRNTARITGLSLALTLLLSLFSSAIALPSEPALEGYHWEETVEGYLDTGTPVCGLHEHGDGCYDYSNCENNEDPEHSHSPACRNTLPFICGEDSDHIHVLKSVDDEGCYNYIDAEYMEVRDTGTVEVRLQYRYLGQEYNLQEGVSISIYDSDKGVHTVALKNFVALFENIPTGTFNTDPIFITIFIGGAWRTFISPITSYKLENNDDTLKVTIILDAAQGQTFIPHLDVESPAIFSYDLDGTLVDVPYNLDEMTITNLKIWYVHNGSEIVNYITTGGGWQLQDGADHWEFRLYDSTLLPINATYYFQYTVTLEIAGIKRTYYHNQSATFYEGNVCPGTTPQNHGLDVVLSGYIGEFFTKGALTVTKNTSGLPANDGTKFRFTITDGDKFSDTFELGHGESKNYDLDPGEYTVTEELINSIGNYRFDSASSSALSQKATVVAGTEPATIVFNNVYTYRPHLDGNYYDIVIHYIDDATGEPLLNDYNSYNHPEGSAYDVSTLASIEIENYSRVRVEGDQLTGTMDSDKEIWVYYAQLTDIPSESIPLATPSLTPDPSAPITIPDNPVPGDGSPPRTGDNTDLMALWILLGVGASGLVLGLLNTGVSKKKNR